MELPSTLLTQTLKKQKKIHAKKISYKEMELPMSKIKNFHVFPEMELSTLTFFLYFRMEISEADK